MLTISHVVKEILGRQIFLQEAINQGVISNNLLAKKLKPEIEAELGKEIKLSAIVMALRRHSEKIRDRHLGPSFSYSIETIKTDIFYVVLEESSTSLNKIQNLYPVIDFKKGGILNIIQGNYEVAVITNKKYKENLLDLVHDEKVLDTIDDLVSVSLSYSKDFLYTPGILYDISRFMAWENINVIDIILTKTEMSLILFKKDLNRCYKILGQFAESNDKGESKV